jgi:APA family basic amino acid/polyamine antiporter
VLGPAFGLAVTVGQVIGVGILRTPGEVASCLPNAGWIIGIWVLGAAYAALCGLAFAELITRQPRSGGMYNFVRAGFGRSTGVASGVIDWLTSVTSLATFAIVFVEYVDPLLPAVRGRHGVAAAVLVVALAALQLRGTRWGSGVQQVVSLLKTAGLGFLIVVCFVAAPATDGEAAAPMPAAGSALLLALVTAVQSVIFAYDGYYASAYFGEEFRAPSRDVPRAIFGTIAIVAVVYTLLVAAMVRILGVGGMAGQEFPAALAADAALGHHGDTAIRVVVLVSLAGTMWSTLLGAPRIVYALARDGLIERAAHVDARGTPTVALAATVVAVGAFAVQGDFGRVMAIAAVLMVANYVLSFGALFVLRRRDPSPPGIFRAWGHPYTTALALAVGVAFLVGGVVALVR